MTTMHTEGPFFVKHGENGFFEIMDGENPETANTLCTRFEWKEREAEMRANGNLFAVAPEMLAALIKLDAAISFKAAVATTGDLAKSMFADSAYWGAVDEAKAAIAKATTP